MAVEFFALAGFVAATIAWWTLSAWLDHGPGDDRFPTQDHEDNKMPLTDMTLYELASVPDGEKPDFRAAYRSMYERATEAERERDRLAEQLEAARETMVAPLEIAAQQLAADCGCQVTLSVEVRRLPMRQATQTTYSAWVDGHHSSYEDDTLPHLVARVRRGHAARQRERDLREKLRCDGDGPAAMESIDETAQRD